MVLPQKIEAMWDMMDAVGLELLSSEQLDKAFGCFRQMLDVSWQRCHERLPRRQTEALNQNEATAIKVPSNPIPPRPQIHFPSFAVHLVHRREHARGRGQQCTSPHHRSRLLKAPVIPWVRLAGNLGQDES